MSTRSDVILTLVVVLSVAALIGTLAWNSLKNRRRGARLTVAVISTVISLPGLWFAAYYLHILPESVWLYRLRSLPASHLWQVFLIPTAVVWGTILPKWLRVPILAGAVAATMLPFFKPIFHPLVEENLRDEWQGNACLQSSFSTCGPASAASILRSLGDLTVTERQLAREAWTSATGTEAWHLARVLRKRGYDIRFSFDGTPPSEDLPGILGVMMGSSGHFIAVMDAADGKIIYIDPLHGERTLPEREFEDLYHPTGFFMGVRK